MIDQMEHKNRSLDHILGVFSPTHERPETPRLNRSRVRVTASVTWVGIRDAIPFKNYKHQVDS